MAARFGNPEILAAIPSPGGRSGHSRSQKQQRRLADREFWWSPSRTSAGEPVEKIPPHDSERTTIYSSA